MRTAIISGVTGHLGSELARQLVSTGITVHGLSRSEVATDTPTGGVLIHRIDGSTTGLLSILEKIRPDVAFHLAGRARRAHESADISAFIDANIHFGTQFLEAVLRSGCPYFIAAGTYLQHFDGNVGGSMNLYAATKDAFEALIRYYVDAFNVTAIRLTLCDIYSEADTRRKLMTDIADACAGNMPLTLVNENARLDLIHVEDAARAFIEAAQLLEVGAIKNHTLTRYSVSSGYDITVSELISTFELISGRKLSVVKKDAPHLTRDMGPWRGTQIPGWAPRVCLEAGIARMLTARGRQPNTRSAVEQP
jgi:nucleoside-diphosphate-sugar epimerase